MTIRIVKGDDAVLSIPVTDKDGNAVSLDGVTAAKFIAKPATGDTITKELGTGVQKSGNTLTITLTDADTATATDYNCEVELTDSTGLKSTVRDENDQPFKMKILADLG